MRVLDLFSGIGGFSLGLERTGMKTVAFCEIEPFCRAVLAKHWPEVPCYDDIRTLTGDRLAADGIGVDLICGGFPCQPHSTAGSRLANDDERDMWPEFRRLIREIRPRWVVAENVVGIFSSNDGRFFGNVLGDLAALGYDAEWETIPASSVGLPQARERVWIIAYSHKDRNGRLVEGGDFGAHGQGGACCQADMLSVDPFRSNDLRPQPLIRRMDERISGRVDRVGALGNAVVPKIPEIIGRAILRAEGVSA